LPQAKARRAREAAEKANASEPQNESPGQG
jgi:hypothetical protein